MPLRMVEAPPRKSASERTRSRLSIERNVPARSKRYAQLAQRVRNPRVRSCTAKHCPICKLASMHLSRPWELSHDGRTGAGADESIVWWSWRWLPRLRGQVACRIGTHLWQNTAAWNDVYSASVHHEADGVAHQPAGEATALSASSTVGQSRQHQRRRQVPVTGSTGSPSLHLLPACPRTRDKVEG